MIGWAAATGEIGIAPLVPFLIVFLWTPPHFWVLALDRVDASARAHTAGCGAAGRDDTRSWLRLRSCRLRSDSPMRSTG
jgi:hypothetical protein